MSSSKTAPLQPAKETAPGIAGPRIVTLIVPVYNESASIGHFLDTGLPDP